ncbi:helicase-exonuclease AddAB subunit AddA [Streptococcus massiliensis]|uniref:ATP-dependent helicase/nuclease subunit A n=1 Tax=Streptococcus massiliensis TaxID=313439 RepID=A0A380KYR5_9STRE|nr:helicase-exonuclease AddAB subunit AddA [Streptococcus massiliensis]SUN76076.1 ATP-dependent nuclease subunit A [Streptococcus massiliensis]
MKKIPFLTQAEIVDLQAAEQVSDKVQKRTPEQIEAIYSSGENILVSASAGSGKTFVMIERILDQILRGVEVGQLFVSTFTVKAAGELKERLEKKLQTAMNQTTDDELKRHLAQQLGQVSTADIGTMDAFAQKLINQHGYLLGIAPHFRILQDASEQQILKNEVFASLFDQYYDSDQAELFKKLVKNFAGNRKNSNGFRTQVYTIYTFLQSTADPQTWLAETFLKGNQEIDSAKLSEELLQAVAAGIYDLEDFLKTHLTYEAEAFGKAKYLENIQTVLDKISELSLIPNREELQACLSAILQVAKGNSLTNLSKKEELLELKTAYNNRKNEKIAHLRDLEQELYLFEFQATYQKETLPLLALLRDFVADFSEQYLTRKIAENAFEFSDISHFAIQLLETFPKVAKAYRDKYHEVMVDEYQDTNHIQERMLELLSNGHNRFMVGDIKQSIYRFRQADPQIFSSKFKLYQENPQAGKLIVLKENFRSHKSVLAATNSLFKRLMDEEVGEIDYNESHYLLAGSPKQEEEKPENQTEFLIYDTDEKTNDSDMAPGEVLLVIKEIIRLHNQGVAFKDITLLVPSRTRNDLITRTFEEYGIPLVSDSGETNYLEAVEVMVMLDTLRTINNPLNDYALVALLKSPMFQFTEDELTRIALQKRKKRSDGQEILRQINLYQALQATLTYSGAYPDLITSPLYEKIQRFDTYLLKWRHFSKTHSLYELIWQIYKDRLYYDYVGALPNGAGRQANLYALSLRANDYEKTGFKGLSRFIAMIDKILESQNDLASVVTPAPQDAVSLMTVHKSKGLEFDYVFLLNMDKTFNRLDTTAPLILSRKQGIGIKYLAKLPLPTKGKSLLSNVNIQLDTFLYQANKKELKLAALSEQMRLLYVAMTRAATKLYLVGKGSQKALTDRYNDKRENGRLAASTRSNLSSFQDWVLAIQQAFSGENLHWEFRFVSDEDLKAEKIGQLDLPVLPLDDLTHNRQSENIARGLDIMESVERLNQRYRAAIELPTVRTPSQIKTLYEPVMKSDGLQIMVGKSSQPDFSLPHFGKQNKVTGAQIGSAVHELMQRLPLTQPMTKDLIEETLTYVQADQAVKEKIDVDNILAFFETDLGQLILEKQDLVRREAPFAMLKKDEASGEDFVVRGIIDGYIELGDRIILFDYKTDKYKHPCEMVERYRQQMNLYAEALHQSYGIDEVEKYLILLGGERIEVEEVDGGED